ncbi:chymotrypsin family serine protease [Leifsonia xyli]|uniref:hypothetical protein n=1 Tax=Leifsonia xyli TaxID=1575 RepID=UPI00040DA5DC|nr:hypothetical protein [Leifsonia xyli]
MSHRILRRVGAGIALSALALSGSLVDLPASADTNQEFPTTGPAFETEATALLPLEGLVSVGRDAQGKLVVARAADAPTATVAAIDGLQARYSNVVERVSETARPFATTDVVGGAGYMIDTANGLTACSLGFSAWTPGGGPAVITAGHCAEEATGSPLRTLPSAEPAAGGQGTRGCPPWAISVSRSSAARAALRASPETRTA